MTLPEDDPTADATPMHTPADSFGLLNGATSLPEPETAPIEIQTEQPKIEIQSVAAQSQSDPNSPTSPAPPPASIPAPKKSLFNQRYQTTKPPNQKPATLRNGKASGLRRIFDALKNFGLGKEKNNFIENLAVLLNSGLSVIDALKTIETETRVKQVRKIIRKVIDDVENGIALWRAMDNQDFFSPYALALIRIGEESGALSKNMEYLSAQQEKNRALRSKVKMAMIYPAIVLTLTGVITTGLAWFVLPQLVGVLTSLNVQLPLVTRIIIVIADFFKQHGSVAVPLVAVFSMLVIAVCKYTRLRGPVQQMMMRVPGIGKLALYATIAQFGVILGSLLKAGVPMLESIRSTADVMDMVYYRKFFYRLADEIEVGQSFASAFQHLPETRKLIPESVQQLIITGERSGKMADMLLRIADIYEKKAEESATKLPIILEPMLLLFIGGLVGTIAFAIIVPIYSIVGNVGR